MKRAVKSLILVIITGVFFVFTGCRSGDEGVSTSEAVVSEPGFGGDLVVGITGAPYNLSVWTSNDFNSSLMMDAVLPGLLSIDKGGKKVPHLAKSIEVSEEGRVFTVEIHEGLKWHDGVDFTAEDLKFTAEYIVEHQLGYGADMYSGVESVEIKSPTKLIYNLKEPQINFIDQVGYWIKIMPKHIFQGVEDPFNFKFSGVGYGPYKLKDIKEEEYYIIERVENWPLANENKGAYLDTITYRIFPDPNSLLLAVKNGEVDLTGSSITVAAQKQLEADKNRFEVLQVPSLGYGYFGFSYRNKYLRNPEVRRAIAMTVDRDAIVKTAIQGGAIKMENPISPVYSELLQKDIRFPEFDIEGAGRVLEAAGYKDGNGNGFREDSSGNTVELELIYRTTTPNIDSIANIFRTNVEKAGIKVSLRPVDPATYTDRVVKQRDFDMNVIEWGVIDDPDTSLATIYHSDASLNFMEYKNEKIDDILTRVNRVDYDERLGLIDTFQEEFVKELPSINSWVRLNTFGASKKFEGWDIAPGLYGPMASDKIVNVYKK